MIQIAQILVRKANEDGETIVVDWNTETECIEMSSHGLPPQVPPKLLTAVESILWFLLIPSMRQTLVLEKLVMFYDEGTHSAPARESDITAFHREHWNYFMNNRVAIQARIDFVDRL